MRALDKVQKKSQQELEAEYTEKGFTQAQLSALFEFGNLRGSPEAVLSRLNESHLDSASEMADLKDSLRARNLKKFEFNMSIVRGIDYYTAVVFEIADEEHPDLGKLCGGGRYDLLPKTFGRSELSGTGAAGGMDRAAVSLSTRAREIREWVYVAHAGTEATNAAAKMLSTLRSEGVSAQGDLQGRALGKQLEAAGTMGARWVMIVGKKEMEAGGVTLRDMRSRAEEALPFEDALRKIKKG